jgi:hypothetical protein
VVGRWGREGAKGSTPERSQFGGKWLVVSGLGMVSGGWAVMVRARRV